MTTLDWIIVVFTLAMATWGYAQGLIVGALSLGGFLAGAFLGSRLGPLLLEEGSKSPYAPLTALMGALVVGGILASLLEVLGFRVRQALHMRVGEPIRVVDGIGGAALLAFVGLGVAWIAGAVALQTPGLEDVRRDIQRSSILGTLNETFPPSGPVLNALARFDPIPEVAGPEARVAPPSSRIARDPQVQRASRSVVKVLGTACGLGVEGSGWVADSSGVVVTNAHVVAGQDDTTVQVEGRGPHHDAEVIWFDERNDLAILRASGIAGTPALQQDIDEEPGTSAAVLGFPQNGPYDVSPARLGQTREVLSEDAYGDGPVRRRVTSLRGRVRSGNSGGPLVDDDGQVVGTIFASTVGGGGRSGLAVPASVVENALGRAGGRVRNGPCAR